MKKSFLFCFIISIGLLITSCKNNKQENSSADSKLRQEVENEFEMMKKKLPIQIPNTPMTIEGVSFDGDLIEFVVTMPNYVFDENMAFGADVVNSDKNVARIINNDNQEQIDLIAKVGLGIRYIYMSSDTGDTLMFVEADSERLKRVREGINSGEIVPYTVLEIFQMEIDKYEFPIEIEEGVWLTDGYIKGNTVYYVIILESEITSHDLSDSEIREMKQEIVEGLKESLISVHKKEMTQKGVRVIYVYKNNNGDEFARVEIAADDL